VTAFREPVAVLNADACARLVKVAKVGLRVLEGQNGGALTLTRHDLAELEDVVAEARRRQALDDADRLSARIARDGRHARAEQAESDQPGEVWVSTTTASMLFGGGSPSTWRRWAPEGAFTAHRTHKGWRIEAESAAAWATGRGHQEGHDEAA